MGDESDPEASAAECERLRGEVAALKQRIADLDTLAHEDSLLRIPNRRGLMRELGRMISRVARYHEQCALLFLDFDGLKQVNDGHGHVAGDAALTHVTALLNEALRASDVIGRYGGDEFCVLLAHVGPSAAKQTAMRLEAEVEESNFTYEGKPVALSVTIGVSMIRSDDTPERLLERADRAMYARKA